jgi:pimeloyl-ACP methyl ester carboxylesterase
MIPRWVPSPHGGALAVHDLSAADAHEHDVPLLLVHPVSFHAHTWAPVARRLQHRGRVYAIDLPGHGSSPHVEGRPQDWQALATDVLEVVGALELESPIGVGHSMGGALLAMAEMAAPGTFRAIWAYEPVIARVGDVPEEIRTPPAQAPRPRRADFDSFEDAYAIYRAKPALARLHDEALRAYVDFGFEERESGVRLRCLPEVSEAMAQGWQTAGAFERLGAIACPVHVVHGHHAVYQARWAVELPAMLQFGTIEAHEALEHLGPLEAPAVIAASIDGFVARCLCPS